MGQVGFRQSSWYLYDLPVTNPGYRRAEPIRKVIFFRANQREFTVEMSPKERIDVPGQCYLLQRNRMDGGQQPHASSPGCMGLDAEEVRGEEVLN